MLATVVKLKTQLDEAEAAREEVERKAGASNDPLGIKRRSNYDPFLFCYFLFFLIDCKNFPHFSIRVVSFAPLDSVLISSVNPP